MYLLTKYRFLLKSCIAWFEVFAQVDNIIQETSAITSIKETNILLGTSAKFCLLYCNVSGAGTVSLRIFFPYNNGS